MEPQFWEQSWQEKRIGFHQKRFNSRLERLWPALEIASEATVFVPLCGKSLDMLWLHQHGHQVLGIELSDLAVRAFFEDNELPFVEKINGHFTEFTGIDQAHGIQLLAGDFFKLTAGQIQPAQAFYDRASLVAMPDTMRADYANHLASLMPGDSVGLLISMNYDPSKMRGPPFPVPDENVRALLDDAFIIDELEYFSGPERVGNLAARGLDTLEERIYRLQRRTTAHRN
jgi:thiopurine S-methyltransferase